MSMSARSMPMNAIINEVMISFNEYRALRNAGTTVHTPPTKKETISRRIRPRALGTAPISHGPKPQTTATAMRN